MAKEKKNVREALKKRTQESAVTSKQGLGGKQILNISELPENSLFKPVVGWNNIDIIPFEVKTKNHPRLKKGDLAYVLELYVHKKVGAGDDNFICLKKNYHKPCPICEELEKMYKQGADEEEIAELKPKQRVIYNVIDKNDKKPTIKLFETSHFLFEKELIEEAESGEDGEFIVFSDLEDGRTIKFKGVEESFKSGKFVKIKKISFEERDEPYDEDMIDEAYSLDEMINIPTYEEVEAAFLNQSSDDDEEEDEKPSKKSKQKQVEDDDDDDDDMIDEAYSLDEMINIPTYEEVEKSKLKKDECPAGGVFGEDCDEHDACDGCENWEACSEAEDAKKKSNKKSSKSVDDDDDDED